MFGRPRAAPSVIDFGGLMDTAQAVALQRGRLRAASARQCDGQRQGLLRSCASDMNQATRGAFRAALERYLGRESAAQALRLGGAASDCSQALMGQEIRQVLAAAHRLKKLNVEIGQLKRDHIEQLIARNAEDSRLALMALDRGASREEMQLSREAQARVDEARRELDAKCAEWHRFLQSHPAPACAQ